MKLRAKGNGIEHRSILSNGVVQEVQTRIAFTGPDVGLAIAPNIV